MDDLELTPWDRQPDEPTDLYARFVAYLKLGPGRSLRRLWHQTEIGAVARARGDGLPRPWRDVAELWRWETRAGAYDDEQAREDLAEFTRLRNESKKDRIKLLIEYQADITSALPNLLPDDLTWSSATSAIKMVGEELRNEFDDLPVRKQQFSGGNQPIGVSIESAKDELIDKLTSIIERRKQHSSGDQ